MIAPLKTGPCLVGSPHDEEAYFASLPKGNVAAEDFKHGENVHIKDAEQDEDVDTKDAAKDGPSEGGEVSSALDTEVSLPSSTWYP